MLSDINEIVQNQKKLILGLAQVGVILGFIFTLISYFRQETYFEFALMLLITSVIDIGIYYFHYYKSAALFLIFMFNSIIIYRMIAIHSGLLVSFLIPVILYCFIVVNQKWGSLIFVFDFVILLSAGLAGQFVFAEHIDPITHLYFTNSLLSPLVGLFTSYIVCLLVYNLLAKSIQKLQEQNVALKNAQDFLIRQDKSEQINVLAGGIAHDFNNLLAASLGNIELLKFDIENIYQDSNKYLENSVLALVRARNLTKQLLLFSKNQPSLMKKMVNFTDLIHRIGEFTIAGTSTTIIYALPPSLWPIYCDEGQISQVLQNIILNASQAMKNDGKIIISVKNRTFDKNEMNSLAAGEYLEIKIQDEGPGIPKENLHKIFAPYFTTKKTGSGLGLAVSYSIVKNHLGNIEVHSSSQGTIFTILLPADSKSNPPEYTELKPKLPKFKGNVLLLEDDSAIQLTLSEILKKLGFSVIISDDGEKTLQFYKPAQTENKPFDLIFADLTIRGGMGGLETLRRLKLINPNVKVILTSGYPPNFKDLDLAKEGFAGQLDKPYTIEELILLLNDLHM